MRQVALDQRVRELPLLPRELDAVPLEPAAARTELAEPLPFEGQLRDLLEQSLNRGASMPTPET